MTGVSRDEAKQLTESRSRNLRQLLIRTTRTLNALIEDELQRRGYRDIRLAHSTLLANLDITGNSITTVAERAFTSKQAMGVLADELEKMGYLTRRVDDTDARTRILMFTPKGRKLMLETFAIVHDIEERYTAVLGEQTMSGLRTGLEAFLGVHQLT